MRASSLRSIDRKSVVVYGAYQQRAGGDDRFNSYQHWTEDISEGLDPWDLQGTDN